MHYRLAGLSLVAFVFAGCFSHANSDDSATSEILRSSAPVHTESVTAPEVIRPSLSRSASASRPFLFSDCANAPFAQGLGGPEFSLSESLRPVRVRVDSFGHVVVAGVFSGTMTTTVGQLASAGESDIFLLKLDSCGKLMWSKRFGSAAPDELAGLALDPEGNIILSGVAFGPFDFGGASVGTVYSAAYLVKLGPDGREQWTRQFGNDGESQYSRAVVADIQGNLFWAGSHEGAIDFGGLILTNSGKSTVVKFSPLGAPLWGKALGGSGDQELSELAPDAAGRLNFGGVHEGLVIDRQVLPRSGQTDVFTGAFDSDGALDWAKTFGSGAMSALSMIANPAGDVYLAGPLQGTADFGGGDLTGQSTSSAFVASLSPSGAHRWSKTVGASGVLTLAPGGYVVEAGWFDQSAEFEDKHLVSAGAEDAFIVWMDAANGQVIRAMQFGDDDSQRISDISAGSAGGVVVVGSFRGTLAFTPDAVLSSPRKRDLFVARLAP